MKENGVVIIWRLKSWRYCDDLVFYGGKKMKANYDFSNAVKNPFAGMVNGKYTATIHYDFTEQDRSLQNPCKRVTNKIKCKMQKALRKSH